MIEETMTGRTEEVDQYLEKLDPQRGAALAQLRSLILETVRTILEETVQALEKRRGVEYGSARRTGVG
jgi:hypothetical protein